MHDDSSPLLVLLSGGLDSTVLLHEVHRKHPDAPLHTLSFDYGQRHARELRCAEVQSRAVHSATHRVVDLRFLGGLVAHATTLLEGGAAVPDLDAIAQSDRDQPPTYVPNRNMMLLSVAAAYAEAQGIHRLYYGAQAQDEYGYWDCTEAFLEGVNAVLGLNRKHGLRVLAPFVHTKKSELVTLGVSLGVDFAQTWSCYRGAAAPCLTCPTCVERIAAFRDAGHADPLLDARA